MSHSVSPAWTTNVPGSASACRVVGRCGPALQPASRYPWQAPAGAGACPEPAAAFGADAVDRARARWGRCRRAMAKRSSRLGLLEHDFVPVAPDVLRQLAERLLDRQRGCSPGSADETGRRRHARAHEAGIQVAQAAHLDTGKARGQMQVDRCGQVEQATASSSACGSGSCRCDSAPDPTRCRTSASSLARWSWVPGFTCEAAQFVRRPVRSCLWVPSSCANLVQAGIEGHVGQAPVAEFVVVLLQQVDRRHASRHRCRGGHRSRR